IAARLRPEHDAAMAPLRRTNRSLARSAGAFLTPRLTAAAGDFVALEGRGRSGARIGHLAMHRPINNGKLVAHLARQCARRFQIALGRARRVDDARHQALPARVLTLSRTISSAFLPPGTAPRTNSRLRSASARTTSRFCSVVRSTP